MSGARPSIKAMLVCDAIITEKGTNKHSLIGVFENINARKFPCVHSKLGVFINFTGCAGKWRFKLDLAEVDKDTPLASVSTQEMLYGDPLKANNLVFILQGLKFEQPGKYEFRLYGNGEVCEIKTLNVCKVGALA